MVKIHQK